MKNFSSIFFILFVFLLFSCEKEQDILPNVSEQTVIIYMLANNNLYKYALDNINEIESNWRNSYKGKCVVILEPINSENNIYLIEIEEDNNLNKVTSSIVSSFDNIDPLDPSGMNFLITETTKLYPSKKYSLILWSHATGWIPPNTILNYKSRANNDVEVKSFGESNDKQMDILDLKESIPSNIFSTIIFDACHMGSVEVLYELKDKADYIISSPTEILAQGFPYQSLISIIFENNNPEKQIAESFFNYYNQQVESVNRSCCVSLVYTKELNNLALQVKNIISRANNPSSLYNNINHIQIYDRYNNHIFYDLEQTIEYICKEESELNNSADLFNNQLKKTILYSAHTDFFVDDFEIKNSCGLSIYIPTVGHQQNIKKYYKNLSWYKDSGYDIVFEESLQE